ncbi:MAG: helix-turn-helix transcriptional regulator, partial [Candidatus Omnitrophica bacterium]|nr:helix-turn-helix transcriptional regulator [Candidatus Omnitrophota bacterium]
RSGKVKAPEGGRDIRVTPGLRLKVLRLSCGLTTTELSEKIGFLGGMRTLVNRWQRDEALPRADRLLKMARIFSRVKKDIGVTHILYGKPLVEFLSESDSFGERVEAVRLASGLSKTLMAEAMKTNPATLRLWTKQVDPPGMKDRKMALLDVYHRVTGKHLDGCLLFYGKPLNTLLDEVDRSKGSRIIKYFRVSAGLSRQEVSDRLGLDLNTVRYWEKGTGLPGRENMHNLTKMFREVFAARDNGTGASMVEEYFVPLLLVPLNHAGIGAGPRRPAVPKKGKGQPAKALWGREKIVGNAGSVIPWLVQSMIDVSENMPAGEKQGKVALLLDTELAELSGREAGSEIERLIRMLAAVKDNNKALERFLKNLEIIKGEGRDLLNKKGAVRPENVIVVTRSSNMGYFKSIEGRAVIAAIDDRDFPETAYLPLLEVTLFAIGKYLGWDEDMLREHYENIPNVIPLKSLGERDYRGLFARDMKNMVIRLIPDAARFDTKELVEMMARIRDILRKA